MPRTAGITRKDTTALPAEAIVRRMDATSAKPHLYILYDEIIADAIIELTATTNAGLHTLCRSNDMPDYLTIQRWLQEHNAFRQRYQTALKHQADLLVDQALQLLDNCTGDEQASLLKMQVDTRKWMAAKLHPKKWGDTLPEETVPDNHKRPEWLFKYKTNDTDYAESQLPVSGEQ